MVRILVLVIFAAIAFALAYTLFKTIPMKKKMTIIGGAVAAAAIGVLIQSYMPFYMSLLAIVAISLMATLIYMKQLEKTQQEKIKKSEERRAARQKFLSRKEKGDLEQNFQKAAGMDNVSRKRRES
ncbi:hypothetical protein [Planococcus sp. NCCP-2050]|uniref:hypothetical protein n=1 Tax=Planococcus sp. NCCP-2050 TaxID=2944679 RepID=UPI00203C4722|nr:hypothetical protein [Planococcus sp. NCCP-2050]GKW46805.1 hypothetical protein NCCP2050_24970 [Planococcus sp. NCCP-2050]